MANTLFPQIEPYNSFYLEVSKIHTIFVIYAYSSINSSFIYKLQCSFYHFLAFENVENKKDIFFKYYDADRKFMNEYKMEEKDKLPHRLEAFKVSK